MSSASDSDGDSGPEIRVDPPARRTESDRRERRRDRDSSLVSNDPLALSNSDQPGTQLVP